MFWQRLKETTTKIRTWQKIMDRTPSTEDVEEAPFIQGKEKPNDEGYRSQSRISEDFVPKIRGQRTSIILLVLIHVSLVITYSLITYEAICQSKTRNAHGAYVAYSKCTSL